jgi:hypothetical protein
MADKKVPETRQCTDQDAELFGCVAVRSERRGDWGVMNPGAVNPNALGGHWATDDEVEGWTVLQQSKGENK